MANELLVRLKIVKEKKQPEPEKQPEEKKE